MLQIEGQPRKFARDNGRLLATGYTSAMVERAQLRRTAQTLVSIAALALGGLYLLLEYPGYGGALGNPSLESIRAAVLGAYDTMIARPDFSAATTISRSLTSSRSRS
jgi:hypothetical protein